ncbi:hypothetical protein [Streptomyces albidus (ex Kaewkla and Franco 2022)]|uniref:hypothetical protein n=1 Tax=Streptomyces albidus (ex Kaewkla and Franco 2022) TaxID=722709 RepID=UPI0015EEB7BB|nr:hypothetical protein [Streptomyces albidus (ex Kaewkla and Franco 2022)]
MGEDGATTAVVVDMMFFLTLAAYVQITDGHRRNGLVAIRLDRGGQIALVPLDRDHSV